MEKNMYKTIIIQNVEFRVYGPHVYIYDPKVESKHSINGWMPTQLPLKFIMEKLNG
jgi:hypothetical protein